MPASGSSVRSTQEAAIGLPRHALVDLKDAAIRQVGCGRNGRTDRLQNGCFVGVVDSAWDS